MIKKAKYSIFKLVLFLFLINTASAVEIRTSVDRSIVNINESVQITFTASESPDEDPDFSLLENDFEILNQSQSSQSSWMNGQASKSIKWILDVMPKQIGTLQIPSISFGDDRSQPTSIQVKELTTSSIRMNDDVFLQVEASPEKPYVQSQIIYTLRVYRRVQITQASLTEPKMEDAIIEKLGEDTNFNTDINGIPYVVTERKYAIFPQKSGVVTIEPVVLQAKIVASGRSRFNGFFSNPATRTKQTRSNIITFDVQAVPEDYSKKLWIPAENLYVREEWSENPSSMKVGEPLTRTLTILSKGSTVAQLPDLFDNTEIVDLKTYPDQPTLKEQKQEDGIIALREQKIAYIASNPGSYTLPAIKVPWFNTKTNKMEVSSIPELKVTAISSGTTIEKPVSQPLVSASIETPDVHIQQVENKNWMWVSIALAVCWLISTLFLLRRTKPKQKEIKPTSEQENLKQIALKLKKACAENNKVAAKDALIAWGKIKYNSTNLSSTASSCEARLRDEIFILNQNLYANQSEQWQGKKLFQFFVENNAREKVARKNDDALEPLYKISNLG